MCSSDLLPSALSHFVRMYALFLCICKAAFPLQKKSSQDILVGSIQEDAMQRILDIDLDFFLADCCPLAAPGEQIGRASCRDRV